MQRIIAVIMILGSSVVIAWASGDIAFPAILCMLGLLGTRRRFTWDLRPERRFITPLLLLLLAILFALHCRFADPRPDEAAAFAWQTIARYFLASMILLLFLRPPDRLPPSLGLFHLASAMAAGQVLLLDDRYLVFRLSELVSVTLVVLYAAMNRRASAESPQSTDPATRTHRAYGTYVAPHACLFGLLLVTVNLGWVAASLLYRYLEVSSLLPTWLWRANVSLDSATGEVSRVGFSASGKLSSVLLIKEDLDTSPVLTITGDGNPGYLRARAFDVYRPSEWHYLSHQSEMMPEQNTAFNLRIMGRTNLFRLHKNEAAAEVTVRHESAVGDAMFTPLGACSVEAPLNMLMCDEHDVVVAPITRNNLAYRAGYTTSPGGDRPSGMQMRRMRGTVDHPLGTRVQQKANRIFWGCKTTAEKIEAVTRYFHTNYTYSLGLEVPPGQDELTWFLLEAPTGYCEYFASGAAVLLRYAGVPTRYVTGFLVTERGEERGTWVARNMDAHAWAEAWDEERGQWVIVEATVQDALGETSLADQLARDAAGGNRFLAELVQDLYEYGLFGVISSLFKSYGVFAGILASMVFLGILVIAGWRLWLGNSRHGTRRRPPISNPQLEALLRMLAAMDRKVRARGFRRNPEETLHAFAGRIRGQDSGVGSQHPHPAPRSPIPDPSIADWYVQYAGLRYCRAVSPERLLHLQQLAESLRPRS